MIRHDRKQRSCLPRSRVPISSPLEYARSRYRGPNPSRSRLPARRSPPHPSPHSVSPACRRSPRRSSISSWQPSIVSAGMIASVASSTPDTSVRNTSRSAFQLDAIATAMESPFTLKTSPVCPPATQATTGRKPASASASSTRGSESSPVPRTPAPDRVAPPSPGLHRYP